MLLVRAWQSLILWRIGLWLFPLRFLREWASGRRRRQPVPGADSSTSVEMISWAIVTAARYVPRATCLTQALAAQTMLRRGGYGSELHIGVAKGPERGLEAHAWLRCGDLVVIGGTDLGQYTPLIAWEETN